MHQNKTALKTGLNLDSRVGVANRISLLNVMDGHREYIDSETSKYNGNVLHVKKP